MISGQGFARALFKPMMWLMVRITVGCVLIVYGAFFYISSTPHLGVIFIPLGTFLLMYNGRETRTILVILCLFMAGGLFLGGPVGISVFALCVIFNFLVRIIQQ